MRVLLSGEPSRPSSGLAASCSLSEAIIATVDHVMSEVDVFHLRQETMDLFGSRCLRHAETHLWGRPVAKGGSSTRWVGSSGRDVILPSATASCSHLREVVGPAAVAARATLQPDRATLEWQTACHFRRQAGPVDLGVLLLEHRRERGAALESHWREEGVDSERGAASGQRRHRRNAVRVRRAGR